MLKSHKILASISLFAALSISLTACFIPINISPKENDSGTQSSQEKNDKSSQQKKKLEEALQNEKDSARKDSETADPAPKEQENREPEVRKEADESLSSFMGDYRTFSTFGSDTSPSTEAIFRFTASDGPDEVIMTPHTMQGVRETGTWLCNQNIEGTEAQIQCVDPESETFLEFFMVKYGSGSADVTMIGAGYLGFDKSGERYGTFEGEKM